MRVLVAGSTTGEDAAPDGAIMWGGYCLPFDAAEEDKMLWRIVKSKPRYDPDWAPETLDVLRSMLQKRPTTRLSSLKTLGHAKLYASYDLSLIHI